MMKNWGLIMWKGELRESISVLQIQYYITFTNNVSCHLLIHTVYSTPLYNLNIHLAIFSFSRVLNGLLASEQWEVSPQPHWLLGPRYDKSLIILIVSFHSPLSYLIVISLTKAPPSQLCHPQRGYLSIQQEIYISLFGKRYISLYKWNSLVLF